MPTLGTFPMHETLRQKLQNLDPPPNKPSRPNIHPSQNDTNSNPTKPNSISTPTSAKGASIPTPQALLSRDPQQLSEMMGPDIPLRAILDLRASFAGGLIQDDESGHGGESEQLVTRVDGMCGNSSGVALFRKNARFISGSFSALDYCIDEFYKTERIDDHDLSRNDVNHPYTATLRGVSTGSQQLDKLLSPSQEYTKSLQSNLASILQNTHHEQTSSHPRINSASGIPFGLITEAMGPPACGKTQLALTVAANAALQQMNVHYLASGGGNSTVVPLARRLLTIFRSLSLERNHGDMSTHSQAVITQALQHVHFYSVQDGYHALSILNDLSQTPKSSHQNTPSITSTNSPFVLILDSVNGCLSPQALGSSSSMGMDGGVGRALVQEVGLTLKRYSRLYHHAILVTNGTVGTSSYFNSGNTNTNTNTNNNTHSNTYTNTVSQQEAVMRTPQPALKNMWKVADIRMLMEIVQDVYHPDVTNGSNSNSNSSSNNSIPNGKMAIQASRRNIRISLEKHYDKSCDPQKRYDPNRSVDCAIASPGIVDG